MWTCKIIEHVCQLFNLIVSHNQDNFLLCENLQKPIYD